MSLKLKYNITTWDNIGLNYWGVPKCGNTSIKYALLESTKVPDGICRWVHNEDAASYIDPETALANGYKNFATVRHPYDRVLSLYKDFGIRRKDKIFKGMKNPSGLDEFVEAVCNTTDDDNVHVRSIWYFLRDYPIEKSTVDYAHMMLSNYGMTVPYLNKTELMDITLTDKHKDMIYDRYRKDFDYGFNR